MSFVFTVPIYVYDVPQRHDVKIGVDNVTVKFVDDVLIIRRSSDVPREVIFGKADVIVGLDEWGRIINVEIDFADYYHVDKEKARKMLEKARW